MISFDSLDQLRRSLEIEGCKLCELGSQSEVRCCVARGSEESKYMILSEAPGLVENETRRPYSGPAGVLLDEIWEAAEMDTNDWYLTNIILCRPIAPPGSFKQNLTPIAEWKNACRPYLDEQIRLLDPKIIVTLGLPATQAVLGQKTAQTMGSIRGQLFTRSLMNKDRMIFPMYHPAFLLHSKRDQQKYDDARRKTWDDVRKVRRLVDDYSIQKVA